MSMAESMINLFTNCTAIGQIQYHTYFDHYINFDIHVLSILHSLFPEKGYQFI